MASDKVSLSFLVTKDERYFLDASIDQPLAQLLPAALMNLGYDHDLNHYMVFIAHRLTDWDKTIAQIDMNTSNALYIVLGEDEDSGVRWTDLKNKRYNLYLSLQPENDEDEMNQRVDFEVEHDPFVFGRDRHDEQYLQYPLDLDLRGDLPAAYHQLAAKVSRRQAVITRDGGEWFIQLHDLAKAPFQVDDEVLREPGQRVSLTDKKQINFGGGIIFNVSQRLSVPYKMGIPLVVQPDHGEFIELPNSVPLGKLIPKLLENLGTSVSRRVDDHLIFYADWIADLRMTPRQLGLNPYESAINRYDTIYLIDMSIKNDLLLFLPNNDRPIRRSTEFVIGRYRSDPEMKEKNAELTNNDIDMLDHLSSEFAKNMSRRQAVFSPNPQGQTGEKWGVALHQFATAPMFVNGRQIHHRDGFRPLRDGDSIEFGATNVLGKSILLRVQYA